MFGLAFLVKLMAWQPWMQWSCDPECRRTCVFCQRILMREQWQRWFANGSHSKKRSRRP